MRSSPTRYAQNTMLTHAPTKAGFASHPPSSNITDIDVVEFAHWLSDRTAGLSVLDVREEEEVADGTIPHARAIPLGTLPLMLHELDRNRKYVILCRNGRRSAQACALLLGAGFTDVYNLRDGMNAWVLEGFPSAMPAASHRY